MPAVTLYYQKLYDFGSEAGIQLGFQFYGIPSKVSLPNPLPEFTVKQMVNAIACTIELWYTREVAKHERSIRVARGDSRVRL